MTSKEKQEFKYRLLQLSSIELIEFVFYLILFLVFYFTFLISLVNLTYSYIHNNIISFFPSIGIYFLVRYKLGKYLIK